MRVLYAVCFYKQSLVPAELLRPSENKQKKVLIIIECTEDIQVSVNLLL